jgi:hypothetical protein
MWPNIRPAGNTDNTLPFRCRQRPRARELPPELNADLKFFKAMVPSFEKEKKILLAFYVQMILLIKFLSKEGFPGTTV